ncbi:MAG: hypothetical protein IKT02_05410 [Bacteroidales bacterium]|nr:hypothetical protein [Bacteroidales bacterium]
MVIQSVFHTSRYKRIDNLVFRLAVMVRCTPTSSTRGECYTDTPRSFSDSGANPILLFQSTVKGSSVKLRKSSSTAMSESCSGRMVLP